MLTWDTPDAQQAGESARPAAESETHGSSVATAERAVNYVPQAGPRRLPGDIPATVEEMVAQGDSAERLRLERLARAGITPSKIGNPFARLAERRKAQAKAHPYPMFREDPEELEQSAHYRRRRGY